MNLPFYDYFFEANITKFQDILKLKKNIPVLFWQITYSSSFAAINLV